MKSRSQINLLLISISFACVSSLCSSSRADLGEVVIDKVQEQHKAEVNSGAFALAKSAQTSALFAHRSAITVSPTEASNNAKPPPPGNTANAGAKASAVIAVADLTADTRRDEIPRKKAYRPPRRHPAGPGPSGAPH